MNEATLLLIEDDPLLREVLRLGLTAGGYRVIEAANGAVATTLLRDHPVDGILVDLVMPVMDGVRFLQWMREEAHLSIPTLVLTSLNDRKLMLETLVTGARDVALKPIALERLLDKVTSLLAGRSLEHASQEYDLDFDSFEKVQDKD